MDSERNIRVSSLLTGARSRPGAARHALSCSLPCVCPWEAENGFIQLPPRHRPHKLRQSKAKVPSQIRRLPRTPSIDQRQHLQDVTLAPLRPRPPAIFRYFGRGPGLQSEGICPSSKPHMLRWLSSTSSLQTSPARFKPLRGVSLLSFLYILD